MRVLLTGGGTAGHVYPALAVAAELVSEGRDEVLFVGTPHGVEARLVEEAGHPFHPMQARGLDRSSPLSAIPAAWTTLVSLFRSIGLLRRERPDIVLGFGGYVSLPVGIAAQLLRIPRVLHEQNSIPGLANRLLSKRAEAVAVTYECSAALLAHPERATLTGNPVRADILSADRAEARRGLSIQDEETVLLVFGGSRGSRHINQATVGVASRLLAIPGVEVLHSAGRIEADDVRDLLEEASVESARYRVFDYIEDMGAALAAADLVVSRAGATTIAEITALGRASILVPYPYATGDHQTRNAEALVEAGASVLVPDAGLDDPGYGELLEHLLQDGGSREKMAAAATGLGRPDAAARVAALARDVVAG